MLSELFEQEKKYLDYFFKNLDIKAAEKIFEEIKNCKGIIILTGVGKSGLVAKKIAATMTSTNSRALFLSPTDALHGDIGIVNKEDVFIFLSKSGESEELLNLLPSLRNKGVKLITLCSNPKSRLAKASDLFIDLPLEKELCPFDMAPTISTSIQMIFGDVMAIALMRHKKFTLDDFGLNHPAGRIGKRITLRVKDIMIMGDGIPTCKPNDHGIDTLVELSNKRCGCVLVIDEKGHLEGIFTDGDLRRTLQAKGPNALQLTMKELMTANPRFVKPEELVIKAIQTMEGVGSGEVSALPVIDDNRKVVGLIKLHDIIQTGV
jgi:arabinose-5-phosphate isomerase